MSETIVQSDEVADVPWWVKRRHALGAYLTSGVLHLFLLLLMAFYILPIARQDSGFLLIADNRVENDPAFDPMTNFEIVSHLQEVMPSDVPQSISVPAQKIVDDPGTTLEIDLDLKELVMAAEASEFLESLPLKGEFGGRTDQGRAVMSRAFGGTAGSEHAVAEGLEWLKRHQREDGSWSFNHTGKKCDETCTHRGNLGNATVGATSMAILCFIGAGHTHRKGAYQEQVAKGLEFILSQREKASEKGDFRQIVSGNSGMYTQGITTIMLCELHGLTRDKEVGKAALDAIKFIVDAQHPRSGGWRYRPGDEQGDTSVVGWQVMAQTSARMSRITVSAKSRKLAEKFLDSVQLENGAFYGYTSPSKSPSMTAVGLLCRMYQGWEKTQPAMKVGVAHLSQLGPSRDNMYYNYYATQVMRHWGGEEWKQWNEVMREMLVQSQDKEGHSQGSWVPRDPHGRTGGRHYMTCLAILTLEVYYRHLPIYQQQSVELGRRGRETSK